MIDDADIDDELVVEDQEDEEQLDDAAGDGLTREQRRSRRHREVRAVTVSMQRLTKGALAEGRLLFPVRPSTRPLTRGDCAGVPRPCPYVSCRHHLYLDVSPQTGAIKVNFPDLETDELVESCSLDVAEDGRCTIDKVGAAMNVTRERARQIEDIAIRKLKLQRAGLPFPSDWEDTEE